MVASTRNTGLKSLKRGEATMKQPNKINSQFKHKILGFLQQLVKALIRTLLDRSAYG
jgi:hypothetical protein